MFGREPESGKAVGRRDAAVIKQRRLDQPRYGGVMDERNLDQRLWVTIRDTGERAFIIGSCHTFPGRFSVWVPSDGRARCVSKFELSDQSPDAAYWIAGFLNGSVPSPPDHPEHEAKWMERRAEFLATGDWPGLREDVLASAD